MVWDENEYDAKSVQPTWVDRVYDVRVCLRFCSNWFFVFFFIDKLFVRFLRFSDYFQTKSKREKNKILVTERKKNVIKKFLFFQI